MVFGRDRGLMPNAMPFLSALLLCEDAGALNVTHQVLLDCGFTVLVAATAPSARQLIAGNRFDVGVYDEEVKGAAELAAAPAPGVSPGVVFAMIVNPKDNSVLRKRVHFLVQKPVAAEVFTRSVKAAFSTILQQKRAVFRHPVQIESLSASLLHEGRERTLKPVTILNLGRGGLCLSAGEMLPQGASIVVDFRLPGTQHIVRSIGTVIWTHSSWKAGVKFTHIPPLEQDRLYRWLDSLLLWDSEPAGALG